MIRIDLDDRGIQAAVTELESYVKNRRRIADKAGITIRDYVRATIQMQGRTRRYAPLRPSTMQTTGRRLVFTTIRPEIKHFANHNMFMVYHDRNTIGWDINMHTVGIKVPFMRNVLMKIPSARGGKVKFFSVRYPYTVPAREVWPSRPEVTHQVNEVLKQWLHDLKTDMMKKYRNNGGK